MFSLGIFFYFVSALVNESQREERLEALLRK